MSRLASVAGICAAACAISTGLGVAVASAAPAPDVIGKTYGAAKGILGQAGMSAVVATVLGDRVEQDECYVTSMTTMTPLDSSGAPAAYNQVQVNLNCYVGQSDKKTPGFSKGNLSPQAVAARATKEEADKEWKASPEGQAWCADFEAQHPEWAPVKNCHSEEEAKAMEQTKWLATPAGQDWCAASEAEHPEWAPIAGCHPADAQSANSSLAEAVPAQPQ